MYDMYVRMCVCMCFSSYTARVYELLVVLKDMEKGVYERTMVTTTTESSGE